MTMQDAAIEIDELPNFTRNDRIPSNRGQMKHLTIKDKVSVFTVKGSMGIRMLIISNKNTLAYRDLWLWLIDHDVPWSEIDEQPSLCLVAKNLT